MYAGDFHFLLLLCIHSKPETVFQRIRRLCLSISSSLFSLFVYREPELVRYLMESFPHKIRRRQRQGTALFMAQRQDNRDVVQLLVR